MGDVLEIFLRNILKNMWFLFFLFFIFPLLLSVILTWNYTSFLESEKVSNFVSISGYLFTFSSLALVFVLFKTFKLSDHKRSAASKNFLEKKGFKTLSSSLENILHCIEKEETKNLRESCMNVREIFYSLNSYGNDVDLKAYKTDIKDVFNLISRCNLINIGYDGDSEQLKNMPTKDKLAITNAAESLLRYLKQRSSLDES